MEFTKLIFENCPYVAYAHVYQSRNYNLMQDAVPCGAVELLWAETGHSRRVYEDGRVVELPEGSLAFTTHNKTYRIECDAPMHRHLAVGFWVDYDSVSVSAEHVSACIRSAYLRPTSVSRHWSVFTEVIPNVNHNGAIVDLMRRIIRNHSTLDTSRDLKTTSILFRLLAEVNEEVIRMAVGCVSATGAGGGSAYVREATRYISDHLDKRISVEELSEHLGISGGYLCSVFKKVTGQSVIEYVNRMKMARVRDLVGMWGMSLREAGAMVGISDENYLSRLFRRIYGQSVRELRANEKEER